MNKREEAGSVVTILLLGVLGYATYRGWIQLSEVSSSVAGFLVFGIAGVLYWAFRPRIRRWLRPPVSAEKPTVKVELSEVKPVLAFEPLQHYRGRMIQTPSETRDIGGGQKQTTVHADVPRTDEYRHLASSQRLEIFWGPIDKPLKEIIAKFGVMRFYGTAGDVLGCRVEGKLRRIEELGKPTSSGLIGAGYFNWFSYDLRSRFKDYVEELDKNRGFGVNKYLKNTTIDIHQGEEKDLLLFYMIESINTVFLCTDVESMLAGHATEDTPPLRFEIEIWISGQRYPKTTARFLCTAKWDDFSIKRI